MNTTLVIDGNWLLMSRMFAVKPKFNIDNSTAEKENGVLELEDLMCRSINLVINRFDGIIDNIIIVSDGGSWRKEVKKPEWFEEEYKGNRIKDTETDWKYVYKALEDIICQAEKLGITSCREMGIEGDDWVFHWSRYLNNKGINCVIWSSDADLKQLVQVKNGAFTAWLNESQKGGLPGLFLPSSLDNSKISELEMFMQIDSSNIPTEPLCRKVNAVNYINPADIAETKIICGDAGDNIKPVFQTEKNGRKLRITEKEWNIIKENLEINDLNTFFEKKEQICQNIITNSKYSKYIKNKSHIYDMFEYNRTLVLLDSSVIPQEYQKKMESVEYKKYDLSYIKSNYKILMSKKPQETSIEDIFESISILNDF